MPDLAPARLNNLKPLDPRLGPEVSEWVIELRKIWAAAGLSINQFAAINVNLDKSAVSRYLSGSRVPSSDWFLDRLLDTLAERGRPITPAVRDHLKSLHESALRTAHPHEYRVRLVRAELGIAVTRKLEAERYAHELERRLAECNRHILDLSEEQARLRADQAAELQRHTRQIGDLSRRLDLARERSAQAEQRCRQIEQLLDQMDALPEGNSENPAMNDPLVVRLEVGDPAIAAGWLAALEDVGLKEQIPLLADRAAQEVSITGDDNIGDLVRLMVQMRMAGASAQAARLARRAHTSGRLGRSDLRHMGGPGLADLLSILHMGDADDLIGDLAAGVIACAPYFEREIDRHNVLAILRVAGADDQAKRLEEYLADLDAESDPDN